MKNAMMQWAVIRKKDRPSDRFVYLLLFAYFLPLRLIHSYSSSIEHKDGSPLPSSFTQKEEDIQHLFIVDLIVTMYT